MQLALSSRTIKPLGLAAAVGILAPLLPSDYTLRVASLIWISALAALGLNILMGQAGQVSLGQAGFFGIGAYSVAVAPIHLGLPVALAPVAGVALSALIAGTLGRPILRLRGHYLAIATLGLGFLITLVITNETRWTGGPDGLQVWKLTLLGWPVAGARVWYWITGGVLVVGAWLAFNLEGTSSGRAFRALRDSEVAASVLGIDVARVKLRAFVVAAVYASTAGSLLGLMNGFVTPDLAGFMHSVELVTMVVVGGLGSVFGAILGAAILTILPQVLTAAQEYETFALGLIIVASMALIRRGIIPALVSSASRFLKR